MMDGKARFTLTFTFILLTSAAMTMASTDKSDSTIIPKDLMMAAGKKATTTTVHFEPQVSTSCSPDLTPPTIGLNSYMSETSNRWETDHESTKCLTTKIEILKYCQRVYKQRDINNIVESTHLTQIDVCMATTGVNTGKDQVYNKRCVPGKKWVKPWRCLESPFQSDALLVPSPCLFDHIHNSTKCVGSMEWNGTAVESCNSKGMTLKSYAVLLPCGISLFTGVEFVCCPGDENVKKEQDYSDDYNQDDDEDEDEEEDEDGGEEYEDKKPPTTTTTTTQKPTIDPYFQTFNIMNEHQNYLEAKERLNKNHKKRINVIMSDWNKLEERYQAMRGNDPGGAEEFKRQVTGRFQKTVKSLEDESLAEKKQLISIHGQRILSHLNEKKRESMECYTKALNERPQISRRVRKCLEKLMKYLNKDRHHTIIYFKNNYNSEDVREYTLDRLEQITNTVKEAMGMLGRYIHLSAELKPLVEDYILSLQSSGDLKYNSILSATRESDNLLLGQLGGSGPGSGPVSIPTASTTSETTTTVFTMTTGQQQEKTTTTTTEAEPEAKLYHHHGDEMIANVGKERLEHREATFTVRREVYYSSDNRNVYVIMAFAGFALFGTLVIGMIVLRRRNSPRNQGFLEVNTASHLDGPTTLTTPEEKHVVSMQINGYENPTYKYFEVGK